MPIGAYRKSASSTSPTASATTRSARAWRAGSPRARRRPRAGPGRATPPGFFGQRAALPVNERIVAFNGSYDTRGLANRMARVDWCVVPSTWWETFALVISEAWMFKKPVICSNVGAMADRVGDEVDGLHFEVSDPAS